MSSTTAQTSRMARHDARTDRIAWPLVGLFIVLNGALFGVAALGAFGVWPLWAASLGVLALLYVSAHLNHEAVHRNIESRTGRGHALNEAIGHFGSFLLFLPFPAFRAVHLIHHRATNDPELDCDMWFARRTRLGVFVSLVTLVWGYHLTLRRLVAKGMVPKQVLRQVMAQRALFVAIVLGLVAAGFWKEVLLLWILPAIVVQPILGYLFAFLVHHPHTERGRHGSANVLLSRSPVIQRTLTAMFMWQNYHLMHHLDPRLPFYRYGTAYRARADQLAAAGVRAKPASLIPAKSH